MEEYFIYNEISLKEKFTKNSFDVKNNQLLKQHNIYIYIKINKNILCISVYFLRLLQS